MHEERIYQTLFEHSAQGMVVRQGKQIILANQSFADMVGHTIDEVLAFSFEQFLDLIHPHDQELFLNSLQFQVNDKNISESYRCRFIRRDGEIGWWSVSISAIEYEGRPAILETYFNITEHKRADDTIRQERQFLADLLNALPIGVCLNDETGHYRIVNDAYCEIYDFDRENIIDQHYTAIMPPDQIELANQHFAQLLAGNLGIPVERKRQRKDGSIVYIEAANALVKQPDGQKMVITVVRDITERKETEEVIHANQKLLHEIATNYPRSYITIIETDLTVSFTGGQEFTRQHLDPNTYVGLHLEQIFGEHTPAIIQHYHKAFAGEEITFELLINDQHQQYKVVPLPDPDGNIPKILVVTENITERKKSELALRESLTREQMLGDIIRNASIAIGVGYPDGSIGMFNPATLSLTGYSEEELKTIDWFQSLTPPEWHNMEAAKLAELHRTKRPVRYEKEYLHKDGTRIPIELAVHPQLNEHGDIASYVAFITDITERKQMLNSLRASEAQFRTVINDAPVAILLVTATSQIKLANQQAETLFGYDGGTLQDTSLDQLIPPTYHEIHHHYVQDFLNPPPQNRSPTIATQINTVGLRADGTQFNADITLGHITLNDEVMALAFVADATTRVELERQHLELQLEQERSSILASFMRDAAHEFRTPLSVIETCVYLLNHTDTNEQRNKYNQQITSQIEALVRLVTQLNLLSHLTHIEEIKSEKVDINKVLHQVVLNYQKQCDTKQIDVHFTADHENVYLSGDPTDLEIAFSEIFDNAIKHSFDGGQINLHLSILENNQVLIMVQDEGEGMSQETQQRAFERFYRHDTAHSTRGFGLGLPIAKRVIELHGGSISNESALNQGTTMRIYLPCTTPTDIGS